jgi:putative ABC transport system permease protein
MRDQPVFAATVILTLGVGIGGNGAVFSVVDGVLLRPLPFPHAEHLLVVRQSRLGRMEEETALSYANFAGIAGGIEALDDVAAYIEQSVALTGVEEPAQLAGVKVSPAFFEVFGVAPLLGRVFSRDETTPGAAAPVVVVSEGAWRGRFGADPEIVGRELVIDGEPSTVVGVMPASFEVPSPLAEIWLPDVRRITGLTPALIERGVRYLGVFARLRPGVSLESARSEMASAAKRLERAFPERNDGLGFSLTPLREELVGDVRPALAILLSAVGLVLLIACVNVGNLLLTRAFARRLEIAVQVALGGTRARILARLGVEGAVLGLAAGVVGLVLGAGGIRLLASLGPGTVPRLDEVALDLRVGVFTIGLALVAGTLVGLLSGWQASGAGPAGVLAGDGGRRTTGGRRRRMHQALVLVEVALAAIIVMVAGLLLRSFTKLQQVEPGFQVEDRVAVEIALPDYKYGSDTEKAAFARQLLDRVESLPGVRTVAVVNHLPFGEGDDLVPIDVEGRPLPPGELTLVYFRSVSPRYFETMGTPLRRGRTFTPADHDAASPVAIVNETFVNQILPDVEPLGSRFSIRGLDSVPREIVGVVPDTIIDSLKERAAAVLYTPYAQTPRASFAVVVHGEPGQRGLTQDVRTAVYEVDGEQPVHHLTTMEQMLEGSLMRERFALFLMLVFSALGLTLAVVGIYGVVSYLGSQRAAEVGVRMALGARRSDVVRLVAGQALVPILGGVGLGLLVFLGLGRLLAAQLFVIRATDPATFLVVGLALIAVGLAAALVPALRSARVHPAVTLRCE